MIERRHRCRGDTQQEPVEREMMIETAIVGRRFIRAVAPNTPAIEITKRAGIPHRLPERLWFTQRRRGLARIEQKLPRAHDQRQDGISEGQAENSDHRVVRHQPIERAGAGVDAKQSLWIMPADKARDKTGDTESRDDADRQAIAFEQRRQGAWPRVGLIGLRAHNCQSLGNIDGEGVRRGKLAIDIASAAAMAEVGQIIEIGIAEGAAHFHGRKDRAKPLAIAAGIADGHETIGLSECRRRVVR